MVSGEARLIRSAVNPLVSTIQLPPGAVLKGATEIFSKNPFLVAETPPKTGRYFDRLCIIRKAAQLVKAV
jgi:hypothetical protein